MTTRDEFSTARWEFRCWPPAERAHDVAARLDAATDWRPLPDELRTDTYLLPPDRPDLLPKLRGGEQLEIKRRLEVRDGLERWEMVLSEDWPLSKAARNRAADVLAPAHLPIHVGSEPVVTGGWRTTAVDKMRRRWRDKRSVIEVTRVVAPHSDQFTIAIEAERIKDVQTVINALGLADRPNRNYRWSVENDGWNPLV